VAVNAEVVQVRAALAAAIAASAEAATDVAEEVEARIASIETSIATALTNIQTIATNAATIAASLSTATSTTSTAIDAGSKTFAVQAGKVFVVGTRVTIANTAAPTTRLMYGIVTAYAGTSLTVAVDNIVGTGTYAAWTIRVTGDRGPAGEIGGLPTVTVPPSLHLVPREGEIPAGMNFARNSIATRFNRKGLLETVPANTLRVDYDPITGARKGWLIEEARTNIVLNSSQLDNTGWTLSRVTVVPNAAMAPDGTMSLDKVIPNGISGLHGAVPTPFFSGVADNIGFSAQAVLAAAGYTKVLAQYRNKAGLFGGALFNLATGVAEFVGDVAGSGRMVPLPTGGYRCEVSWNSGTGSALSGFGIEYYIFDPAGAATFVGDGTSGVFMGQVQLEMGAAPSSYIPTTSAAVTRAADVLTMPVGDWFNQAEGSVYLEGIAPPASSGVTYTMQFSDGTNFANDIILVRDQFNRMLFQVNAGSVSQVNIPAGTLTPGQKFRLAIRWKKNDFAASLNGAAVVTDTVGDLPSTPITTMKLGLGLAGLNEATSRLVIFPRGLSNADLVAISSPSFNWERYAGDALREIDAGGSPYAFAHLFR
jgi:hypothetical protein